MTADASSTLPWLKEAARRRFFRSSLCTTMKRQGCMLYPLGALSPASRMRCRSSGGIGVPSKLGVARRSRIAWLKVFSCFAVFAVIALSRPGRAIR